MLKKMFYNISMLMLYHILITMLAQVRSCRTIPGESTNNTPFDSAA